MTAAQPDWPTLVAGWIRDQPPGRFAQWAAAEADIVPDLMRQWPRPLRRAARGWLGAPACRALAQAGPAEMQAIVDRIIAPGDTTAAWAWAHEAWLIRQLLAARDAFLTP